jgi:predicted lipoprotein with Yx(FWY)xxD motif
MKRFGVLLVLLVALTSMPAAAQQTKNPPELVLKTSGTSQAGNLGSYCWTYGTQTHCNDTFAYDWPPAKPGTAQEKARVRIKRREKPKQFSLDYWRQVNEMGEPQGESTSLEYELKSRRVKGRKVWEAWFTLPGPGHFYLRAFGQWTPGDAFYDFHLQLD